MAVDMSDSFVSAAESVPIEHILRDELAHGDALVGTIAPILRHLLANDDHSVFGDEIIARVRGMLSHIAAQLLDAVATVQGSSERVEHDPDQLSALSDSFVGNGGFLAHVHGLALEWQLTERLHGRLGLDPVLSPLLQALIASTEPATAGKAMALLAAQAKFAQNQRRMQLPLAELPGDLLHTALLALRNHAGAADEDEIDATDRMLRGNHDESRSRLGLIARLVTGMGGGATAALSIAHAGTAMFLSALALASGQDRDLAILATNEGQLARFALAMRAAGLRTPAIAEQFVALHPAIDLPEGFDALGADHAAAMLSRSAAQPGA